ncbi:hypothetical protein [Microbulbifer sp. THAF38]|uniref:hypothetical protein n=1 Tax=Microbulbifer sp. THAF38 TaxID=2587856 RepID=UPI0012683FC2|nr:hypothetical protein [Microbulbifer sp. THAF38]QFT57151.1 hypothetical protein FIU95_21600 [Microbulbifer sp. THAF38]
MGISQLRITSSFTVLCETDTFILIRDKNDPDHASVTNAADYTVEWLAQRFEIANRRIVYQDTMGRFDELCHKRGKFDGFKPLTESQQRFFIDLLACSFVKGD